MCTDVESIQTHCICRLTFKVGVTTVYSALVFLFISFIVSKNRYICKTVFDYNIRLYIHTFQHQLRSQYILYLSVTPGQS